MHDLTRLRIGQGIDIHPFAQGRDLIIGGVTIKHDRGLEGHSDADVLTHAIIDAILGATGQEDIGKQFPNTDPQWKNVNSITLLTKIWKPLCEQSWKIVNIDCTLLAESPKLSPYISEIKNTLAKALAIATNQIGVKATTSEKLGFVGREEGILASAVVLLCK